MANVLYFIPQKKTTTLATVGGIDASQTTNIKLTDVTGIDIAVPGIICLSWSDPIIETAYEYVTYTSIDGTNVLAGVTRGAEGSTGRVHSNGVTIAYPYSKSHINNLNTGYQVEHNDVGTHKAATVTTLKAAASDVTTGTNDTKIITPKALRDATQTITSPIIRAYDGWIDANETWTYASASTITVPTGAAAKYAIGDRIKWTQTTVKYGVIVAVANTLLTIAVNTDYTVANAAITLNYYSHQASPLGYPEWFNFDTTVTWTAGLAPSGTPSKKQIFSIIGHSCTINIFNLGYTNGTTVTEASIPLPVNPTTYEAATGQVVNNNVPTLSDCIFINNEGGHLYCASATVNRLKFFGTCSF